MDRCLLDQQRCCLALESCFRCLDISYWAIPVRSICFYSERALADLKSVKMPQSFHSSCAQVSGMALLWVEFPTFLAGISCLVLPAYTLACPTWVCNAVSFQWSPLQVSKPFRVSESDSQLQDARLRSREGYLGGFEPLLHSWGQPRWCTRTLQDTENSETPCSILYVPAWVGIQS